MATLRGFGSKYVALGILQGMQAIDQDNVFDLWVPATWTQEELHAAPRNARVRRIEAGFCNKLVNENWGIRRSARHEKYNCLFSLGDTGTVASSIPHLLLVQQPYLAYPSAELDFSLPKGFRLKLRTMQLYFRLGMAKVSLFTVQSTVMARRLCEKWGMRPERVKVIPTGISCAPIEEVPDKNSQPSVCYVASASPHKNHAVLAPMISCLARKWPRIMCYVTVSPSQVPELLAQVQRLKVEQHFSFCGALSYEHSIDLIRNSSVSVIPSKLESFGIPYYEAMAQGRPVVVADRDFAQEACGEAGLYADANDGVSFARQVDALLSSSEFYTEMSMRCSRRFEWIAQPWSSVACRYLNILQSL